MTSSAFSRDTEHRSVDNFEATAHRVRVEDRHLLHELTVSVFWPHREADLAFMAEMGEGYLAVDEIGRAMGSAMYFACGDDFAMFGMMVTAPRLQELGTGRWLLNKIMADCAGRDLRLSATRAGFHLYQDMGFIPVGKILQHQGVVGEAPRVDLPQGLGLRAAEPEDFEAICAIDRHAYGADRRRILDRLIAMGEAQVIERSGEITGFALCRAFGRGRVVGPVMAESEPEAMALIAHFVAAHPGQFLRVDTFEPSEGFARFLTACGMRRYDSVTEMRVGPQRRAQEGAVLWALAAQSIG